MNFYYSPDDLKAVVKHLRAQKVFSISLWGRSMGACTV